MLVANQSTIISISLIIVITIQIIEWISPIRILSSFLISRAIIKLSTTTGCKVLQIARSGTTKWLIWKNPVKWKMANDYIAASKRSSAMYRLLWLKFMINGDITYVMSPKNKDAKDAKSRKTWYFQKPKVENFSMHNTFIYFLHIPLSSIQLIFFWEPSVVRLAPLAFRTGQVCQEVARRSWVTSVTWILSELSRAESGASLIK